MKLVDALFLIAGGFLAVIAIALFVAEDGAPCNPPKEAYPKGWYQECVNGECYDWSCYYNEPIENGYGE